MNVASRRDELLETASELFYREGIRPIGVDTIVARSGVSKMTLYHLFRSKDELAIEYLRRRDAAVHRFIESRVVELAADPGERPLTVFDAFAEQLERDDHRGCHLINSLVEFPELDHPIHQFALALNAAWRAYVLALVEATGVRDADTLGDQLFLLLEGAFVAAVMERSSDPMRRARRAAGTLIQSGRRDSDAGGGEPLRLSL